MTSLLYIILGVVFFLYALPVIIRFLLILFFKRWTDKIKKNIYKKANDENYKEHKDGETVVQYKKEKKSNSDPGGEYVEFEDLNDHS